MKKYFIVLALLLTSVMMFGQYSEIEFESWEHKLDGLYRHGEKIFSENQIPEFLDVLEKVKKLVGYCRKNDVSFVLVKDFGTIGDYQIDVSCTDGIPPNTLEKWISDKHYHGTITIRTKKGLVHNANGGLCYLWESRLDDLMDFINNKSNVLAEIERRKQEKINKEKNLSSFINSLNK